jgi:hypothetical protein
MSATTPSRDCRRYAPYLSELLDGQLDAGRASAVRGHTRTCSACERVLTELGAQKGALAQLGPLDPPPSLWGKIQEQLGAAEVNDARRSSWWFWWQGARPTLRLAGAGLLAVGLAVGAVWWRRSHDGSGALAGDGETPSRRGDSAQGATAVGPEVVPGAADRLVPSDGPVAIDEALASLDQAEAEYKRAVTELAAVVAAEAPRWPAATREAFARNAAIIDAAVERQRQVFRDQPADLTALDGLHASYRRQIDFLSEALVRGEVTSGRGEGAARRAGGL